MAPSVVLMTAATSKLVRRGDVHDSAHQEHDVDGDRGGPEPDDEVERLSRWPNVRTGPCWSSRCPLGSGGRAGKRRRALVREPAVSTPLASVAASAL